MSNPGGPGVMYKIFSSENKKFWRKMFCHILWLDIVKFFSWQFQILWELNLFTPFSIPLSNEGGVEEPQWPPRTGILIRRMTYKPIKTISMPHGTSHSLRNSVQHYDLQWEKFGFYIHQKLFFPKKSQQSFNKFVLKSLL